MVYFRQGHPKGVACEPLMATGKETLFYAQGDTRTPTWLGSLAFTLGIVLKIAMFKLYGVQGLAIAISIYYLFSLCIQLFVLWRRGGMQSTQRVLVHE